MTATRLNLAILFLMGINGALHMPLLVVGIYGFGAVMLAYAVIFPALAILGAIALFSSDRLGTSKWIGAILLTYVGIFGALVISSALGWWLHNLISVVSTETFHLGLYFIALVGLLIAMKRRNPPIL